MIMQKPKTFSFNVFIYYFLALFLLSCSSEKSSELKSENPEPVTSKQEAITWKEPITGMEFIKIKEGCFEMGCSSTDQNCDEDEYPPHEVCLDEYWIGKFEVTQIQWMEVFSRTRETEDGKEVKIWGDNPSNFPKANNLPVEYVTWNNVQKFLRKLNIKNEGPYQFRLPTEAEWEYAARNRGKVKRIIPDEGAEIDKVAWYYKNSKNTSHSVGQKLPNELGIYDLRGNVWEWCSDWYGKEYYSRSPKDNPTGPDSGKARVKRGGAWNDVSLMLRVKNRYYHDPGRMNFDLGFRVVMKESS